MQVLRLDHIHIYAEDPEASANFYFNHFEATTVERNTNNNGDLRIFLALGHQILVLGTFPQGMKASIPPQAGDGAYNNGFGISHFGLNVSDVDEAIAELNSSNISVLSAPVLEKSGLKYAYFQAPDGVVIELTEYDAL